ncbi:MAG: VWA domain-containing protein [Candidatus Obscuribacterales bacterium]|nr:VWA domain-containing protein [Candidatus Obscuribacterales bacterium]
MAFANPFWLLLLGLLPLFWFWRGKQYVGLSALGGLRQIKGGEFLLRLPLIFLNLAWIALVAALARPQIAHNEGNEVIMSRDIIVAVDISGSMGTAFAGKIPPPEKGNTELDKEVPANAAEPKDKSKQEEQQRRIDAAQSAITRFVRQRFVSQESDRIGIMAFDDEPHWSWPLTDDLKMIYRKGVFIDHGVGGGTNFGNTYPGPIDAACEHFDECGKAATKVIIMVTDGEDYLHSSTISRLYSLLTDRSVRLYVIGVGERLTMRDVDITQLAASVGGTVFLVEDADAMARCFDMINQLERSEIKIASKIAYHDVFYYFVAAALVMVFLAAASDVFIVSR